MRRMHWGKIAGCLLVLSAWGCSEAPSEGEPAPEVVQPESVEAEEVEGPRITQVNEGIASSQAGSESETVVEEEPSEPSELPVEEENPFENLYSDNQHLIMEYARNQYPTYKLLHQYAVGPGCGPISGVCHNTKEYPDLHSSANMLDTVGLNCNVLIDGPAVTENVCERRADQLIITSGLDVGFKSSVGTLIVTPQGVACGQDPAELEEEEGELCIPEEGGPTWNDDIAPIIQSKCGNCHGTPPTGAPMALTTYEDIIKPTGNPDVKLYDRVLARMQAQTMPPMGGNTNAELQLIEDWIDNCHTRQGENVSVGGTEAVVDDLCIRLQNVVPNGMSDGEGGVDFSVIRTDPETQKTMIVAEYEGILRTEPGSHYVRFPNFGELTDLEQALFLYTLISGDPNGDGIFGFETGDAGLLIKPGDPEKSYFVWRMMGWGDAPQMPLAGQPLLPPAQLAVMCWIQNMDGESDLEPLDDIDYNTCYNLLEHFADVVFDPDAERNH